MVQKPDIQYVTQFYSYGSEAKVLELKPAKKQKKSVLPKAAPQQKICIAVDPVALGGILIALVLAVVLAVSVNSYLNVCNDYEVMTNHVIELQNTNVQRQREYASMYDLTDIEAKALALGMVSVEQAEVITFVPVTVEPEVEPTWWENISWFLKGLFA